MVSSAFNGPVPEGYVTPPEASRILNTTYEITKKLMRGGKLKSIRKGRFWFVTIDSVNALVNDPEFSGTRRNLDEDTSAIVVPKTVKKVDWKVATECPRCNKRIFHGWCSIHGLAEDNVRFLPEID